MFRLLFHLCVAYVTFVVAATGYHLDSVSLTENKYDVKLENIPTSTRSKDAIQLYSKYGQRFSCELPTISVNTTGTASDVNMAIVNSVLEHLHSRCLTMVIGWWTYEFCYRHKITQFHVDEENPTKRQSQTLLGYFSSETDWDSGDQVLWTRSYHSQNYTDGDLCDITFKPRVAEVRFTCAPGKSAKIASVIEVETCVYLIEIGVPSLCAYPRFKSGQARAAPVEILCHPYVSPDELVTLHERELPVRHPTQETKRSTDDEHPKSADRVITLWFTHRRLLSRRQRRTALQIVKLAKRFFSVLHYKTLSEASPEFYRVVVYQFIREILLPGKPVSWHSYMWHYSLMRLDDGVQDLMSTIDLWNDRLSAYEPRLLWTLQDFAMKIQTELKTVIHRATGVSKLSHLPVYNLLEAITLYNSMIKLTLTIKDKNTLQKLSSKLMNTHFLLGGPENVKPYVIFIIHRGFKYSPVATAYLQLSHAQLQLHLDIMKLKIYQSEKELSYRRMKTYIEHSVNDMLADLQHNVLVVRKPSRSSPNPKLTDNPYRNPGRRRSTQQQQEEVEDTDSQDADDSPAAERQGTIEDAVWANVIEKVFQKVFPGISVFQAPSKPGGSETLYIYSSVEKGKEHKRSNRQESAYRFTVKGAVKQRAGASNKS